MISTQSICMINSHQLFSIKDECKVPSLSATNCYIRFKRNKEGRLFVYITPPSSSNLLSEIRTLEKEIAALYSGCVIKSCIHTHDGSTFVIVPGREYPVADREYDITLSFPNLLKRGSTLVLSTHLSILRASNVSPCTID